MNNSSQFATFLRFLKYQSQVNLFLPLALKTHPWLFLPIARLRETEKKQAVRRNTDIVIEGFWRCANHFATYAFMSVQSRQVRVAHHFHAPSQLMLAQRWDIPALLLIRQPIDAVCSATVFLREENPLPFLKFYNIFHSSLLSIKDQIVISDFSATTSAFGNVIANINERYDRNFDIFEGTTGQVKRVQELIREEHERHMGADINTLPLPSSEKAVQKERVKEKILGKECSRMLAEAEELYAELLKFDRNRL